jgi:hypothetical protein
VVMRNGLRWDAIELEDMVGILFVLVFVYC